MKKILCFLLLSTVCVNGQVGISNIDPKAQLDISATNAAAPSSTDGILIPRVNAFPAINPTADQNGMMIFLTTAVSGKQPGFYYWEQSSLSWVGVGSRTANQWNIDGNAGTNPTSNFIGTTDNQDVIFKRNNVIAGRLSFGNTHLGVNSGSGSLGNLNTYVGVNAGASNINGIQNVYMGRLAGGNGNAGSNNVFVGNAAGLFNTASDNVFLGAFAGNVTTTGSGNVFTGTLSGSLNSTGSQNTFVGIGSGQANFSGNGNTLLGNNTDVGISNLSNATAIGLNALVNTSNSMVLGSIVGVNGATNSTNVGIGTTAPLDRLHVVGNIRMADGTQSAGRVLTSDANGRATWQNASVNAWGVTGNSGTSPATNFIGTTDDQDIVFKRNSVIAGKITASNLSLGVGAMNPAVTGTGNLALGANALAANTVGVSNIAIGTGALAANTATSENVAIGFEALKTMSFNNGGVPFQSNNTAIGYQSMMLTQPAGIGIGEANVAVGAHTLRSNTTGGYNVAVGSSALQSSTTAGNNTAVGYASLFDNTTGTHNTSLGAFSLFNNITGDNNIAVGSNSLPFNEHGDNNIAIGFSSMFSNRNGGYNIAIGLDALRSQSFTNGNVPFAQYNVAIGYRSMFSNQPSAITNGLDNVAVGSESLTTNTTGSANTAIGRSSLAINSTGNNNTAIGYNAYNTINQGIENTGLGSNTATNSTILNNTTAVGSRAMVGNSNCLVLGSISGINGATSSVNVGIGTIAPQSALEVVDANVTTSSTAEGIVNISSNNTQAANLGGSLTLSGFTSDGATNARIFGSVEGRKTNSVSGNAAGYLVFKTNDGTTLNERIRVTAAGDVGIGTAIPGGQLELSLNEGRKPGSNTWTIPSDARLKIVNGDYQKGLDAIAMLRPISYNYKNGAGRTFDEKVLSESFIGFLAQEVQTVFPEAVGTDEDGFLNFNIHPILVASLNAIKELKKKGERVENELENIRLENSEIREKYSQLERELESLKQTVLQIKGN